MEALADCTPVVCRHSPGESTSDAGGALEVSVLVWPASSFQSLLKLSPETWLSCQPGLSEQAHVLCLVSYRCDLAILVIQRRASWCHLPVSLT